MRTYFAFLLCLLLVLPACLLAGCSNGGTDTSAGESGTSSGNDADDSETPKTPDPRAASYWDALYTDEAAGLSGPESVYRLTVYENGAETEETVSPSEGTDVRFLFAGETAARAVVPAEGYCLTLPGNPEADFSLGKFRSQYKTDDYCLTVTYEDQNPYGIQSDGSISEEGYELYMKEWLIEQIDDVNFLSNNQIMRTRPVAEETVGEFTVKTYCMQINLASKMQYPCYQIAIIRPTDTYDYFYLLVLKSTVKMLDEFDALIASFREVDRVGTPSNGFVSYELKANPNWSDETRAYFEQLQSRTDVGFGAFHEGNDDAYTEWLWGETALNVTPDVYMTYLHIGWYGQLADFSETFARAETYAGGNGFDGKPVFNLTYQFTETNNATGGVYTPMFDILRGKLDDYFRSLAAAIKAYGKPVLFRLNNEMNTDWTDYCGMMTLLDPDIFQMTWMHLYELFEEEGVDNCIWIFNPISTSCPYSNWGEAMCYMPGADYVQMLGLTNYQMNNGTDGGSIASFRDMYTETAEKMLPYFSEYPWIIGEFACGAGGEAYYDWGTGGYVTTEKGRNADLQAQWVQGMLDCFRNNQDAAYEFCSRIKIAVWFSCNDYADIDNDGNYEIINYLKLDETCAQAIALLREYLSE